MITEQYVLGVQSNLFLIVFGFSVYGISLNVATRLKSDEV